MIYLQVQDIITRNCKKLNEVREKRPRPHLDDKIITAWNGNYYIYYFIDFIQFNL